MFGAKMKNEVEGAITWSLHSLLIMCNYTMFHRMLNLESCNLFMNRLQKNKETVTKWKDFVRIKEMFVVKMKNVVGGAITCPLNSNREPTILFKILTIGQTKYFQLFEKLTCPANLVSIRMVTVNHEIVWNFEYLLCYRYLLCSWTNLIHIKLILTVHFSSMHFFSWSYFSKKKIANEYIQFMLDINSIADSIYFEPNGQDSFIAKVPRLVFKVSMHFTHPQAMWN